MAKPLVVLGLDVGTTAIKCSLTTATHEILGQSSATIAHAPGSVVAVSAILLAVQEALRPLIGLLGAAQLNAIAICGQMHGIVWWSAADVASAVAHFADAPHPLPWSELITWQDTRCSRVFLDTLQQRRAAFLVGPEVSSSPSPLASGYGLATYAHILAHAPATLERFDTCGTIMDLVAFLLAGLSSPAHAFMDTTNAFSWGGFDLATLSWDPATLDACGIPAQKLPHVRLPGTGVVGETSAPAASVFGLPLGVPVYVPMGDHPCALAALLDDAALDATSALFVNIGTSAQLAFVLDSATTSPSGGSFEVRPYFDAQQIAVVAALTGGNVFAAFVASAIEWTRCLCPSATLSPNDVYANVIAAAKRDTTLTCRPTLLGERTPGLETGILSQLAMDNWTLGDMSAAIAKGIVDNLFELLPAHLQASLRTRCVVGSGNALVHNELLRHYVQERTGTTLRVAASSDAAVGATLVVWRHLTSS
ncbi:hypothetical protein SPRG_09381 [Saprolegnia parasitica CBS 223.65]|uniref:Carbohydrate kinase FGGY N-terminal domain-containing protein n=1 Tax=Saprolegnia parasitica (strain CBS 223.65) TaxID=695850 RepID=A0A067C3R9_SAPPC|nr:hypothetical protein SPRG_09381 [Saprolegnia parasitica CBS 223.65]KDO25439.1 hypothetical protein SPRG_09381 [Saprolegnia parasitica CBS 223.65]|eukprot:XP_012203865.1 hypothetical protein SPRG_09381 [Saprolegnia parasitica CBS 223.65]